MSNQVKVSERSQRGALTWVGHSALGHQLRQQDSKRPHVRLDGEFSVKSGLGSGPLYGELGTLEAERKR